MNALVEILKILIPAGSVFAASYSLVKRFLDNDKNRREHELKKTNIGSITPLKLQAYERIVIYLERMNPNTLIVRVNRHGMNARQLQLELVNAIKSEFEHNLSQQIYMSAGAWEMVKNAKEEITQLINITATKVPADAPSNELAMMILSVCSNLGKKLPCEIAVDYIKKEIAQNF